MVPAKTLLREVIVKCQDFVKRHHLKTNAPHKDPGRQQGSECVPGKIQGVLRNLSLRCRVLPFIRQTDINYQLLESGKKNAL